MDTMLGKLGQSHLWCQHPQGLIFSSSGATLISSADGDLPHDSFPSQVLAQHGRLRHRHRGERGCRAPAAGPPRCVPVAEGPAET